MRITKDQVIAGVPAKQLRDAFQRVGDRFTHRFLAYRLKLTEEWADACAKELAAEGYIEQVSTYEGLSEYQLTLKGGTLANASGMPPISRKKAQELVAGVIERAKEINSEDEQIYRVSKLLAFGSFITDKPTLGDVDIAFELTRKDLPFPDADYAFANRSGRRFPSGLDELGWASESVLRRLKNRSSYISLHPTSDTILATTKTVELFSA